jgi:hypothetical protein
MILFIFLLVFIIVAVMVIFFMKDSPQINEEWQIKYLEIVYPLSKGKITSNGPIFFNDLEFIFTTLLPPDILKQYSIDSYKAFIPGPNCEELPCPCDSDGNPSVQFDPDPIWDNKWPPCNISEGVTGIPGQNIGPCCASVSNYKKCINSLGNWGGFDTWSGVSEAPEYNPPMLGQIWKPTLFPLYTGLISKYNKRDWDSFYNKNGDTGWTEVIHSFFPSEESGNDGTWFYRAKGSGIWLNLGKTFVAKNKIHALILLTGLDNTVKVIQKEKNKITFWLGNQVKKDIPWLLKKFTLLTLKDIVQISVGISNLDVQVEDRYTINRLANTGDLDKYILEACEDYDSIQFTIQPNIYPGWTTEILYKGIGDKINNIQKIPKDYLKIFDITKEDKGENCNFSYPMRWLYCEQTKAWLNPLMDSKTDPTPWMACSKVNAKK